MNQFNAITLLALTSITSFLIHAQSDEVRILKDKKSRRIM
jgi:hypothetical protein